MTRTLGVRNDKGKRCRNTEETESEPVMQCLVREKSSQRRLLVWVAGVAFH